METLLHLSMLPFIPMLVFAIVCNPAKYEES